MNRQSIDTELPAPLTGTEPDTFVHYTITERWPRIARRVISENDYPSEINRRLRTLIESLPDATIRPLDDPGSPDEALWNEWITPHQDQSWLECPWFFGETYFYRRIIEATGYFRPGPGWHDDPFTYQKDLGYSESIGDIRTLAQVREEERGHEQREDLIRLLKTALWGNQADLSMWEADAEGPDHLGTGREEEHVLADDTEAVLDHIEALGRPARIDVWADNAGFELLTDLILADGLLSAGLADPLVFHVKAHPTFVSDATPEDVHDSVERLAADDDEATRSLGVHLQTALAEGRLRLQDSLAWTSPLRAREFPANVNAELARADLLISKGDANYRRLLGDRHWSFTTPFEEILSFFPTPVLALRTSKSELASGLTQNQVDRLEEDDPDWLVNGRWGVIQFADS